MDNPLLQEIEGSPPSSAVRIWSLSGAGFVVRAGDDVVYIDPWLVPPDASRTTHRVYTPPFAPQQVKKALAVLSTHEHEDHCNARTLIGINGSAGSLLVGPGSSAKKALAAGFPSSSIVTLAPGDAFRISPSLLVKAFAARDPYEEAALMFLLETPRGNIFHSGDSSYFEGFKEIGGRHAVDVALLNFGKQIPTTEKPYYMNAERLASAAKDLNAGVVIPMHWNLWVETREDPTGIAEHLRAKSPNSRLVVLEGGQKIEL